MTNEKNVLDLEQYPEQARAGSIDDYIEPDVFEPDGSEADLNDNDDLSPSEKIDIAQREDRWVWRLRMLTGVVLLSVAIAVCVFVYVDGRQTEKDDFEQDFAQLGEKVVTTFDATIRQRFGIIQSFAEEITAQANGTWPMVLPARFSYRGATVSQLAQLFTLMLLPQVRREDVADWVAFSTQHYYQWKYEAISLEMGIPIEEARKIPTPPPFPTIIDGADFSTEPKSVLETRPDGPYYPTWVAFPATGPYVINVDMAALATQEDRIESTMATGRVNFQKIEDYWGEDADKNQPRYSLLKTNPFVEYHDDAFTIGTVPVFREIGPGQEPAAVLLIMVYWKTYFFNLLPPGANGVIVVLQNDCDQKYSYQVDGSTATFLGKSDLHDSKYDYLGTGTSVESILGNQEWNTDGCHYSIRAFPSQDLEDSYKTNKPWIYAVALAALFLFTSAVFVVFAYVVERRQKLVLNSALQSGQLVSSLFPEAVREKLYEEQAAQAKLKEKRANWKDANIKDGDDVSTQDGGHLSSIEQKVAIANLYSDTTILLADLVGFTAWSSKRSPAQVFQLLETIFGEFDRIAAHKSVFKVETIGDCYVAATGLPEPQQDHAVIMCRFASMCLQRMNHFTLELAETLGADTADLTMRFGLHSGPTTAGVLRGQKARFQLFGDTINTAARMESNGQPGRIQCSQETADILVAKGKGHWLTPREDKIVAKGKGEMQTFWVDAQGGGTGTYKSATMSITSSSSPKLGSSSEDVEEKNLPPRLPPNSTSNGGSED